VDWAWVTGNFGLIAHLTAQHLYLALVPVLAGTIIAVPLGIASVRWGWLYPPVLSATSVLYALPSLALFVALIAFTGLSDTTVIIALTVYSLAVLVPNVVDGLRSVPDPVRQAAAAMGFTGLRSLVQVELPIAVPIVIAGLRVATVSSISLVSVGQLIGIGGLGYLFIDGEQRDFPTEIYTGIGLIVLLALVADALLVLARRLLTPWERTQRRAARTALAGAPWRLVPWRPGGGGL
jgi:osmoprotectant transport system permease protein